MDIFLRDNCRVKNNTSGVGFNKRFSGSVIPRFNRVCQVLKKIYGELSHVSRP